MTKYSVCSYINGVYQKRMLANLDVIENEWRVDLGSGCINTAASIERAPDLLTITTTEGKVLTYQAM